MLAAGVCRRQFAGVIAMNISTIMRKTFHNARSFIHEKLVMSTAFRVLPIALTAILTAASRLCWQWTRRTAGSTHYSTRNHDIERN